MPAVRVIDEHLLAPVLVYSGTGGIFQNELQLDVQGGLIREQIGDLLVVKNDFNVVAALTGSVFTGPVVFLSGASGSIQALADGSPFIRGGNGIDVTSGSDGSITIAASGSLLTFEALTAAPSVTFSGDVYIEGTLFGGSPLDIASDINATGTIIAMGGLSGSLTSLADGTPYLIAGAGIAITTGSSGQITIASTIDTGSLGRGSSGGLITELVLNEAPAGLINGSNSAFTIANTSADPTAVMLWLNGQLLTPGSDFTVSGNNITFLCAAPRTDDILLSMYTKVAAVKQFAMNEPVTFPIVSGITKIRVANVPYPATSLMIFRNGQLLTQDFDYTLTGRDVAASGWEIDNTEIYMATYSYTI